MLTMRQIGVCHLIPQQTQRFACPHSLSGDWPGGREVVCLDDVEIVRSSLLSPDGFGDSFQADRHLSTALRRSLSSS